MSAKRPRPAIPVLVHVDNPAEAASVTVDTSTIESKMNTVINNQERIYDKIPTSAGGGSADLTTVNEKITSLAETVGPINSTYEVGNLLGRVKNISRAVGDYNVPLSPTDTDLRSLLYNVRESVGNSTNQPTTSGGSVRDLLFTLKGSIGPASSTSSDDNIFGHVRNLQYSIGDSTKAPSLTGNSIRDLVAQIKAVTGTDISSTTETSLIGATRNLVGAVGSYGGTLNAKGTTVRSFLYNLCQAVGDSFNAPTTTGTTVRDLLAAIKTNTASGDDLTTVNEKITAINAAVGDGAVVANNQSLIGLAKGIKASLGSMDASDSKSSSNIKGRLYNIQSSIGDALNSPTATGTTVRDLLTAIKENTASGGSGGSADLTTVNEKTTALVTAIGSAADDSSTVSVIGLLKSITDKY